MAVMAAAALLDELMGRNRNNLPNEKQKEMNWEDPEVCRFYLVRFCPHDLFVNTRADLGPCSKIHDDELRQKFQKSNSFRKSTYEDEFMRFCKGMLNEVERKIIKGKQRLALTGKGSEPTLSIAQQHKNEEQITLLSEKINRLVDEAEQMGIQGNVEKAQGLMKLCDQLKEEREQLRRQNENSHWQQTAEMAAAQEKQMEVCSVCGAFLIVGDAQQRIDDHLTGKQHVGYAKLKVAIEEIMTNRQKSKEDKDKRREEERKEKLRSREEEERKKEKERRKRREKEDYKKRSKSRYRSRSPRHRHRSSSRSRSRSRHRSRDGDRERDRNRDHGKKHRSHEKSSRHSSGHRSRSKSSERQHKDKDRKRSREDSGKSDKERPRNEKDQSVNGELSHHSSSYSTASGGNSGYFNDADDKNAGDDWNEKAA